MSEPENSTPGIEVGEQQLDDYESGFIAGVFAAWGIKQPTEDQFRDAMELLIADETADESESQDSEPQDPAIPR